MEYMARPPVNGAECGGIFVHFSQGNLGGDLLKSHFRAHTLHNGTTSLQVAHHITHAVTGHQHINLVHRLKDLGSCFFESQAEGITAGQPEGNFIGINRVHLSVIYIYPDITGIGTGKRSCLQFFP